MVENIRYFIVTPGRTGSSLLAAVLADCGVDFGMSVDDWDRSGGDYEDRDATRAARYAAAMYRYGRSPQMPGRLVWLWHRRGARRCLGRALRRVGAVKVMQAHLLLQPATDLGYRPRVIVSTRDFRGYMTSSAGSFGHRLAADMQRDYVDSIRNGRMACHKYGGVEIDFAELTDPNDSAWADRLGALCGIEAGALVVARDLRLKAPRQKSGLK